MTVLMLDSGAYSAWTKGQPLNIEDYTKYVLENIDCLDYIVNLDVIPGRWRQKPTKKEFDLSAKDSWGNYIYMLEQGVPKNKLIPVFHQHENFGFLRLMLSNSIPYIGLSPANDETAQGRKIFLDECMKYVCDKDGNPIVKFHGFGVNSLGLMKRYPWFSVDSSSWVWYSMYGMILVPRYRSGEYCYDEQPWRVFCTTKSPRKIKGRHFNNYSKAHQQQILDYLRHIDVPYGVSELLTGHKRREFGEQQSTEKIKYKTIQEGVINTDMYRDTVNIIYFSEFAKTIPDWPTKFLANERMSFI